MLQHWRAGYVHPRTALAFGLAGIAGAYLGGRASQLLDGALLLVLFASAMALTALAMWRGGLGKSLSEPLTAWLDRLHARPAYQRAWARSEAASA